jgi:hypothetical protein
VVEASTYRRPSRPQSHFLPVNGVSACERLIQLQLIRIHYGRVVDVYTHTHESSV